MAAVPCMAFAGGVFGPVPLLPVRRPKVPTFLALGLRRCGGPEPLRPTAREARSTDGPELRRLGAARSHEGLELARSTGGSEVHGLGGASLAAPTAQSSEGSELPRSHEGLELARRAGGSEVRGLEGATLAAPKAPGFGLKD